MINLIAHRYAKALFSLVDSKASIDKLFESVNNMDQILTVDPMLNTILFNGGIKRKEKISLLKNIFTQVDLLPEYKNTILLLVTKLRINLISEFNAEVKLFIQKSRGEKLAEVISACELDEKLIPLLNKKVNALGAQLAKAKDVKYQLICSVDPTLLGGLIIRLEGLEYDFSLKGNIDRLSGLIKHELIVEKFN